MEGEILSEEKGQWVWVPERMIQAFETQMAHYNATHTSEQVRTDIVQFEKALAKLDGAFFGDTDNCPLKHSFGDGIYVREIFIPQGTVLTGKIHKHKHPNFLMRGEVVVVTEGGGMEHLQGPLAMISPAGTKRAVVALTDVWWITVHGTTSQDLEIIESELIAPDYESYTRFRAESALL